MLCIVCNLSILPTQSLDFLTCCGHIFHSDCVHFWLEEYFSACPECGLPATASMIQEKHFPRVDVIEGLSGRERRGGSLLN
uniref:RING-type domain-containing protein n=1 Tax=Meloidogyne hapla TaxID=6305 RepID=A0A1I8B5D3_MELHA